MCCYTYLKLLKYKNVNGLVFFCLQDIFQAIYTLYKENAIRFQFPPQTTLRLTQNDKTYSCLRYILYEYINRR